MSYIEDLVNINTLVHVHVFVLRECPKKKLHSGSMKRDEQ